MAKGSFRQNYLSRPFSLFNVYMAVSYLAFENEAPVLWGTGRWTLDKALEIKPDSPDAVLLLAWSHYRDRDLAGAISTARRVITLDPDFAKAWLGLGLFLRENEDASEAVVAFKKVLDLYPDCPQKTAIDNLIDKLERDGAEALFW
jgi:tetratricopeptide (TPR) repeat protein